MRAMRRPPSARDVATAGLGTVLYIMRNIDTEESFAS